MVKKFRLDRIWLRSRARQSCVRQADGAVWFQQGGTVVLATAVSCSFARISGLFPLNYRL